MVRPSGGGDFVGGRSGAICVRQGGGGVALSPGTITRLSVNMSFKKRRAGLIYRDETAYSLGDRGLTVVSGRNEDDAGADSNGTGKSALVMAAMWGLTGKSDGRAMASPPSCPPHHSTVSRPLGSIPGARSDIGQHAPCRVRTNQFCTSGGVVVSWAVWGRIQI